MVTKKRKTERKQNSACDACRLRRVKCDRDDPEADCKQCVAKKLRCVCTISQKLKEPQGARVLEARKLFGLQDDDDSSATRFSPPQAASSAGSSAVASTSAMPYTASSPPISSTNIFPIPQWSHLTLDQKDDLVEHLVENFSTGTHYQLPCVNWPRFSEIWAAASKRYSRLDPYTQVLVAFMAYFGARMSNHRHVNQADLEMWGQRRSAVCDALEAHAEHLFNSRGIYRHPRAQSITTAMLLILTKHQKQGSFIITDIQLTVALLRNVYRSSVTVGRLPGVSQEEARWEQAEADRLALLVIIYDSMGAAGSGFPSSVTEEDLEIFCPTILQQNIALDAQGEGRSATRTKLREGILGGLSALGRFVCKYFGNVRTTEQLRTGLKAIEAEWQPLQARFEYATRFLRTPDAFSAVTLVAWWLRTASLWRWRVTCDLRDRLRSLAECFCSSQSGLSDASCIMLLNHHVYEVEQAALMRLRELAALEQPSACLVGLTYNTLLPLRPPHDLSKGVLDILSKPPDMVQDWSLDDQISDAELLLKAAPALRYTWGPLPSLTAAETALQELRARKAAAEAMNAMTPSSFGLGPLLDAPQNHEQLSFDLAGLWDSTGPQEIDLWGGIAMWSAPIDYA